MKQTKSSGGKSVTVEPTKSEKTVNLERSTTTVFMIAVLDISWQMAIVVLVPIIGGYELDKHLSTTPLLTIIGFVLAMLGTFAVVRRALRDYNGQTMNGDKGGSK